MPEKKKTTKKRSKAKAKKESPQRKATKQKRKLAEYQDFILFTALPRVKREEVMELEGHTQKAFAKQYGVNEVTLTNWKDRPGFWDEVARVRKRFFKNRTADVLLALETKNTDPATVNGNDVRVLLTYTEEYNDRQQLEHKVDKDVQAALDRIAKVLK